MKELMEEKIMNEDEEEVLVDQTPHGKYVAMRREFLLHSEPEWYLEMQQSGTLNKHLADIQKRAKEREERIVSHWKKTDREYLAAEESNNYIKKVQLINNFIMSAEEIIREEMIYV